MRKKGKTTSRGDKWKYRKRTKGRGLAVSNQKDARETRDEGRKEFMERTEGRQRPEEIVCCKEG